MTGLGLPGGGRVLFTTRDHGNLSTQVGPDAAAGSCARERLRERLDLHGLVWSRQVHGSAVRRFGGVPEGAGGEPVRADGHATALRGVGMMVLVADCLPVALSGDGAVAMLHAGWRGLAAGVLEEGVRAIRDVGGRGGLSAVIGPGAGVCCYAVGEEVHDAFGGDHPHREGDRLDLRSLARERLRAAGVRRIEDVPLCTICEPGFFSHRREGDAAGRQAGVAWLE